MICRINRQSINLLVTGLIYLSQGELRSLLPGRGLIEALSNRMEFQYRVADAHREFRGVV